MAEPCRHNPLGESVGCRLCNIAADADYVAPEATPEAVNHPAHYGGGDNPYEAIKVINAWGLDFNLGNTVKYISRAGKKDPAKELEDLKKARWYLDWHINQLIEQGAEDHA